MRLALLGLLSTALAACPSFPDLPFHVSGRDIISNSGAKVVYAGVNWPGAADTMLPEGLQYNSIANIVGLMKGVGVNIVRLTYAIQMIDDIYSNNPNQTLAKTLTQALGQTNGAQVLTQVLKHNPQFNSSTTRLQVFDAVAAELNKQKIWVHLDNHVSKAEWCCGTADGNAWFGDTYFDVTKWKRGLGYMAAHAKSWPNLASMALRNELRQGGSGALPYTWNSWVENVIPAADAIHGNNSNVLIFFSGQNFDTDDTYFTQRQTWNSETFTPEQYSFTNKIVYELHNYQNSVGSCSSLAGNIYNAAYCAMNTTDPSCPNHGPVVMTEFGFDQTDGSSGSVYALCIESTLLGQPGGPGGWMQWTISGSYYIRSGVQDSDDTWGLLAHDWSTWRNQTVVNTFLQPFLAKSTAC